MNNQDKFDFGTSKTGSEDLLGMLTSANGLESVSQIEKIPFGIGYNQFPDGSFCEAVGTKKHCSELKKSSNTLKTFLPKQNVSKIKQEQNCLKCHEYRKEIGRLNDLLKECRRDSILIGLITSIH